MSAGPAYAAGDIVQVAPLAGRWGGSLLIVARCTRDVVEGYAQVHRRGSDARFDFARVSLDLVIPTGGRVVLEVAPGPLRDTVEVEPFYADGEAWA